MRLALIPRDASRRSFDPAESKVHRFSFRRATLGLGLLVRLFHSSLSSRTPEAWLPDLRDFHPRLRTSSPSAPACVEVGTPVAQRPPHRSRRAVFPHRALQPDTLSIARRKVCQFGSVVLTELVACVDFVRLSTPSAISGLAPCHDLLRADPTPRTASAASPCR